MPNRDKVYSNDLKGFSGILSDALREVLLVKGEIELSREPVMREKEIVSFAHRLRVDGLEKFSARTVFSSVKFYMDTEQMELDRPVGALIIFIEVEYLSKLLLNLGYPRIDEDDEESVLDGCGTFANLVAGGFVKDIYDLGYVYLQMSHFESYINTAINGIAFASDQSKKYEISFFINGLKRIVAELTMAPLPKAL